MITKTIYFVIRKTLIADINSNGLIIYYLIQSSIIISEWYLKFTLISQGYFPLLFPIILVCVYTYEFWLSLCKIARSSVILLLPLFTCHLLWYLNDKSHANRYLHGEHMFLFLFTVLGCSFTPLEITHIKTNI